MAHELAEVELAAAPHLGRARVAEMRVVRPDDDAALGIARKQVAVERVERLAHVPVAQVPRGDAALEHRAVILLGVLHQARVLLRLEEFLGGDEPILARVFRGAAPELDELRHDLVLAALVHVERSDISVRLRVLAEMVEAAVAEARALRRRRIDPLEVLEHLLDRGEEAVEIEPVEARARPGVRLVVRAQPRDEVEDDVVAPHPRGEALEVRERLVGARVVALAAHVAVDAVGVRPIGFDGNRVETLFRDEPARDRGALAVELVGAVGGLADQHEASAPEPLDQPVVIAPAALKRLEDIGRDRHGGPARWPRRG